MLRQVTGVSFVLSLASVLASLILFIQVPTFERLAFTLFLAAEPSQTLLCFPCFHSSNSNASLR